jgi:hypothetical protein
MKPVWTKGTFIPALHLCGPVQPIPAFVWGDYAIHRPVRAPSQDALDGWAISYLPMGRKCGERPLLQEAKACAEQFAAYCQQHGFALTQKRKVKQHFDALRVIAREEPYRDVTSASA